MQVITDLKENKWHNLKEAGAYEWWYFDGIDEDEEFSFVAIFYAGNPFSPDYNIRTLDHLKSPEIQKPDALNFCAVSFNLYQKGRVLYRIIFEYEKNKFVVQNSLGSEKFCFDKSNFYFDETANKFYLNINLSTSDLNNKFKAEFIFSVRSKTVSVNKTSGKMGNHFWLPSASVCDVEGKFKFYKDFKRRKTGFIGLGYHDHNWGREALFQNVKDWYWGRVISEEYSVVYFYVVYTGKQKESFKKIIIFKNGKQISQIDDFKIRLKNKKNYWLLNYNKKIVIDAGEYKLNCRNETKIDNGPFYIRFLSKNDFTIKDNIVLKNAVGFSEYINPQRLTSGFLKPFVKMRIKRIS
ncbi:MAG: hypothetical protein ABI462_02260 [Ignavibacteria bacterium]